MGKRERYTIYLGGVGRMEGDGAREGIGREKAEGGATEGSSGGP